MVHFLPPFPAGRCCRLLRVQQPAGWEQCRNAGLSPARPRSAEAPSEPGACGVHTTHPHLYKHMRERLALILGCHKDQWLIPYCLRSNGEHEEHLIAMRLIFIPFTFHLDYFTVSVYGVAVSVFFWTITNTNKHPILNKLNSYHSLMACSPLGPYILWPLMDIRSTFQSETLMGIFPTAWAASVWRKTPLERQMRPADGRGMIM